MCPSDPHQVTVHPVHTHGVRLLQAECLCGWEHLDDYDRDVWAATDGHLDEVDA